MSTRGLKFKFGEGERVLCYEPDPTKAKVLYESKVLEVCVSKDGKGRKIPEYLIHFNGWSSSWDRCVTEEFVLKDNEDNRSLQKRLAEAASLNLIHPIRKKSKKKKKRRFSDVFKDSLSMTAAAATSKKRTSATTEDEESEDNNWRDRRVSGGGGGSQSGAESNASHCSSSTADGSEKEDDDAKQMDLELPDVLKKKLEEVHHLIKQKNKLLSLPSNPNVISILEGYVKNYSANAFCVTPEKPKAIRNQIQAEKNISLCKEVMDGIRIYFDFTLPMVLLYEEERAQYAYWMQNFKPPVTIKEEVTQSVNETQNKQIENECETSSDIATTKVKASPSNDEVSLQSLKPHKLIKRGDQSEPVASEVGYPRRVLRSTAGRLEVAAKMSPSRPSYESQPPLFPTEEEQQQGTMSNKSKECKTTKCSRSQQKQQRSNCGIQIPSSPSPPQISSGSSPPSLSAVDSSSPPSRRKNPPPLIIPSHVSSSSSSRSGPTTPTASVNHPPNPPHVSSDVSAMIDRTMAWSMIPQSVYHQVPPPPSLIYGAHHLTRLFVKMPEMLTRTNISDYKLTTIHGHLELFLKYLVDCQEELFTEEIANNCNAVEMVAATAAVPSSQT